jgi:hypothetical protein
MILYIISKFHRVKYYQSCTLSPELDVLTMLSTTILAKINQSIEALSMAGEAEIPVLFAVTSTLDLGTASLLFSIYQRLFSKGKSVTVTQLHTIVELPF